MAMARAPFDGPWRGGPRDDDGAIAAVGPIGGLGWRNQGGWTDVDRAWRCPAGARRHAAHRGMVETSACSRRCTSFWFSLGPGKSEQPPGPGGRKAGLAASELGWLRGPPPILPLIRHLVLVLPWSGEERTTPWSRGLTGRSRRERDLPRGPPPRFRLVGLVGLVGLVSVRFVLRLLADPPLTGGADREEHHQPRP